MVSGLLLFKTLNDEICTHPYTFAGLQTQKGKLPFLGVEEGKAIEENKKNVNHNMNITQHNKLHYLFIHCLAIFLSMCFEPIRPPNSS